MNKRALKNIVAGFTLVELLVGMVIGLIGIAVVTKVFTDAEESKRNVSTSSDAQTSGAVAIYSLTRELRFAGYGMNSTNVFGCTLVGYNSQRSATDFTISNFAPVQLNPASIPLGDDNTDILMVAYSTSNRLSEGVSFNDLTADSVSNGYQVSNRGGFVVGGMVLATQSGSNCLLSQVTALPGAADDCNVNVSGATDILRVNDAYFKDPYNDNCTLTTSDNSKYNKSVPSTTYTTTKYQATLYDMGRAPKILIYAIRNSNLTVCDFMRFDCGSSVLKDSPLVWVPIASNVVMMKAELGWDTTGTPDGVPDAYSNSVPSLLASKSASCQISRAMSVRIALLARNSQKSREVVTSDAPLRLDGTTFPTGGFGSDWQNYRYKTFETTVPLRNVILMGPQVGC